MAVQQQHATVCFVRHGQSEYNAGNRFTGWTDIDLTDVGREEASVGGAALRGFSFDRAFTSELTRAQETLAIVLKAAQLHDVPTMRHWRLNERHYGALQGQSKLECIDSYGMEQVRLWRNAFDVPPPLVPTSSEAFPGNDPKYEHVPPEHLPRGECLKDTLARCHPFWIEHVMPELRAGRNVLIAAHGHSIRALVKHLDSISDEDISQFSVPNGIPLLYHLDQELRPIRAHDSASELVSGVFLSEDLDKVREADWLGRIEGGRVGHAPK